jgi:uncharacterized DUF497 family protein
MATGNRKYRARILCPGFSLTALLAARSIIDLDFEWDDIKAAENVRNHGVSFAQAALAFRDPFAVEWIDLREDYGEERIILLGMAGDHVLTVVYTERAERIRIISARQATKNEQNLYYRQNAP